MEKAIVSDFDDPAAGADGWTVEGDPVSVVPTYKSTGGNPGGYIETVDRNTGVAMFWIAPNKFLLPQLAMYDATLSFDLKTNIPDDDAPNVPDVIFKGTTSSLALDFTAVGQGNPTMAWTRYTLKLNERFGWRKDSLAGPPPTRAEFKAVLASLQAIKIRAEYTTRLDTDGLDNVRLGDFPLPSF